MVSGIISCRTANLIGFYRIDLTGNKAMKSLALNTAKTLAIGILLIGIAPLLPVIGLMHLIALGSDESTCTQTAERIQSQKLDGPIDRRVAVAV